VVPPETGCGQDPADRAGAETVSEAEEFTLDAPVAPGRILRREAHHEVADLVTDRRAAAPARVGPFFRNQAAVPGQQRAGSNDPMPTQLAGE
jgi:hypothetical protein